MRRRLATSIFVYGYISSIVALLWLSDALASVNVHPIRLWLTESLFVFHGAVLVLTFHRTPGPRLWPAALKITASRVKAARVMLLFASANVGGWLAAVFVLALQDNSTAQWALLLFLASCYFLSAVYIALHWAFRPENLLPRGFLLFVSNPLAMTARKLAR
jgi:hypothetical protein